MSSRRRVCVFSAARGSTPKVLYFLFKKNVLDLADRRWS